MKHIKLFCVALALSLLLAGCSKPAPPPEPEPLPLPLSSSEATPEPEPPSLETPSSESSAGAEFLYPVGMIGAANFIDHDRATYDGTMILEVPAMEFSGVVRDGTTDEVLNEGVGLFPEGQLPGPENRNVCIAGHRDIHGKEFWDIDKVTDGDLFYLTYHGKRYIYEYVETMLTEPDDWTAIRVKEYSAITLQSCDPIWVASHRIFKIGKLISIEDVEEETSPAA